MPRTARLIAAVMALAAWVAGGFVMCNLGPERSVAIPVGPAITVVFEFGLESGTPTPVGPAPIDASLLTWNPCEPPCWQGLVPELSTEDDVNTFLETSKFVDRESIFRGDITLGSGDVIGVSVQWRSSARDHGGQGFNSFHIEGGVVRSIKTCLDCEVTLEELLERYGPPDALRAMSAGIAEWPYVVVYLYYPARGLMCELKLADQDEPLQPETRVVRAWYFARASLESLTDPGSGVPFPSAKYAADVLQEWQGYGLLEMK